MIYYIATFLFILVTLILYIGIEVYNERKHKNRIHNNEHPHNDLYLLEHFDAIMHTDLISSLSKH